jgi:hypothetical protein
MATKIVRLIYYQHAISELPSAASASELRTGEFLALRSAVAYAPTSESLFFRLRRVVEPCAGGGDSGRVSQGPFSERTNRHQ